MKISGSLFMALFLPFLFGGFGGKQSGTADVISIEKAFKNPDGSARPKVYWWWLNGFVDRDRIKEELHAIKNAGLGGVDIFEIGFRPDGIVPAGPAFMSDSSLADIAFAIREAGKLDLEVGLNLSSSWNAGGTWVKPKHAAKTLYVSKTAISSSGSQREFAVPFPTISNKDANGKEKRIEFNADGKPVYRKEVAVLAIPVVGERSFLDTARIIDVSAYLNADEDLLTWKAPKGEWEIHRYVCSNTGEQLLLPSPNSVGPMLDHFDAEATEAHFMYFIKRLQSQLGDLRETALKNFYLASFEARTRIWTERMAAEFQRLNGYNIRKWLPAVFDEAAFAPDVQARFQNDLKKTISELMINNHYKKGREVANRYGLKLISESGGPGPPLHNVPVEALKALGALDVPRGEFWINHSRYAPDRVDLLMLVKEIASASRIYGHDIVELEAFTSFQNWQEGPGDMKPIGDRAFCEGMSRAVIHGFTHNPPGMGYPGIVYAAGTHYNDRTTWWSKVKPFNDYLSRISCVFQSADFQADVLYYYGDDVPNFAAPKNTRFAAGSGYDYEIINTDILLDSLTFRDGWLTLANGARFSVLAMGNVSEENEAVHKKMVELRRQGAVVTDANRSNVSAALTAKGIVPDFDYPDKESTRLDYMTEDRPVLDFIHYAKEGVDFYFIRNTRNEWVTRSCLFRQQHKAPSLWDPVDGAIHAIPAFRQLQDQIEVPLTFPPHGAFFVEFRHSDRKPRIEDFVEISSDAHITYSNGGMEIIREGATKAITLKGEWKVSFDPAWGGPNAVTFPELVSWTASADKGIKYYSGTASYEKSFETTFSRDTSGRIYLDLGEVSKVADVWLNGEPLGITWTPPYRYDVTDLLTAGTNTLKIDVVNTWSNRIIGDLNSVKKFTNTNLKEHGSRELTWAETPLLESGLLGPVTLHCVK